MWSLTRPDAPSGEPLLIVDNRVTGATQEVLDVGVRLGMPRREAEALAPFATVMVRDVGDETRRRHHGRSGCPDGEVQLYATHA